MTALSILFLSCRRLHYLRQTVESARSHFKKLEPNVRPVWICFDNGSSEEDQAGIMELGFDVLWLSRENIGIGPAMNRLVGAVRTPYFLNLQDDWVVDDLNERLFSSESVQILESDDSLGQIKLDTCHFLDFEDRSVYVASKQASIRGLRYYTQDPKSLWGGFTFPPAVTRTLAVHRVGPFREDQPFRRGWAESEYSSRFSKEFRVAKSPQLLIFKHIGATPSEGWTAHSEA